jgi:hypothetical protein
MRCITGKKYGETDGEVITIECYVTNGEASHWILNRHYVRTVVFNLGYAYSRGVREGIVGVRKIKKNIYLLFNSLVLLVLI